MLYQEFGLLALRFSRYAATPTIAIVPTIPSMNSGFIKIPVPNDGEVTVNGIEVECDKEPIVAFRVTV